MGDTFEEDRGGKVLSLSFTFSPALEEEIEWDWIKLSLKSKSERRAAVLEEIEKHLWSSRDTQSYISIGNEAKQKKDFEFEIDFDNGAES